MTVIALKSDIATGSTVKNGGSPQGSPPSVAD
jgi:hypothetical protein